MKAALYTIKKNESNLDQVKLRHSDDVVKYIRQFYHEDIDVYESFFILLLNASNITIGYAKISQGGIVGTVVDTKMICKYAIDSFAMSVVLAHNHPSGNLRPSENDKILTTKIKKALKMFDTNVVDHIILTKDSYFSFANEGLI